MSARRLGKSDIYIEPLVLGTNVFGWTAGEATSFTILDAFVDAGFSAIDTADSYSIWVPGNHSESEKIIGRWLKSRNNREKVHVFTKVGTDMGQGKNDLSAKWIIEEVEHSLTRLQTDYIDLYQSHWFDPTVEQAETLEAYDRLIKAGKVRSIGASNFNAQQLSEALEVSNAKDLPRYETLQNQLNLYHRSDFEGEIQDLLISESISALTYFSLAAGFLTGKYRNKADAEGKARGRTIPNYLNEKGFRILEVMDRITLETNSTHAEIAIAWINTQKAVGAPISSATSLEQLKSLMSGSRLKLSDHHIQLLNASGQ